MALTLCCHRMLCKRWRRWDTAIIRMEAVASPEEEATEVESEIGFLQ